MAQALRACTLCLWLDPRFPGGFGFVDEVVALRERLNDSIAGQLRARGERPGSGPRPACQA